MVAPSTRTIQTYTSSSAPTANDDTSAGFSTFCLWIKTDTGAIYVCVDATDGAAVWKLFTVT